MNFNKLNEKKRLVKGQLIVGLDLAKTNHVAVPMLPDGVVFGKPIRFTQSRASFDDLFSRCQEICQKGEATGIMFAMEATGSYWEPLARHFAEKPVNLVFVAGSVAITAVYLICVRPMLKRTPLAAKIPRIFSPR